MLSKKFISMRSALFSTGLLLCAGAIWSGCVTTGLPGVLPALTNPGVTDGPRRWIDRQLQGKADDICDGERESKDKAQQLINQTRCPGAKALAQQALDCLNSKTPCASARLCEQVTNNEAKKNCLNNAEVDLKSCNDKLKEAQDEFNRCMNPAKPAESNALNIPLGSNTDDMRAQVSTKALAENWVGSTDAGPTEGLSAFLSRLTAMTGIDLNGKERDIVLYPAPAMQSMYPGSEFVISATIKGKQNVAQAVIFAAANNKVRVRMLNLGVAARRLGFGVENYHRSWDDFSYEYRLGTTEAENLCALIGLTEHGYESYHGSSLRFCYENP